MVRPFAVTVAVAVEDSALEAGAAVDLLLLESFRTHMNVILVTSCRLFPICTFFLQQHLLVRILHATYDTLTYVYILVILVTCILCILLHFNSFLIYYEHHT